MKKIILKIQCFWFDCMRKFGILPNVWHQCEIDLAHLEADELAKFLKEKI